MKVHTDNRKRVQRPMRQIGRAAMVQSPNSSSQSSRNRRIKASQFTTSVLRVETPFDGIGFGISLLDVGFDMFTQGFFIRDTIRAHVGKYGPFNFGDIEPTPVLGREVKF